MYDKYVWQTAYETRRAALRARMRFFPSTYLPELESM
jgi:hypothetical protein